MAYDPDHTKAQLRMLSLMASLQEGDQVFVARFFRVLADHGANVRERALLLTNKVHDVFPNEPDWTAVCNDLVSFLHIGGGDRPSVYAFAKDKTLAQLMKHLADRSSIHG